MRRRVVITGLGVVTPIGNNIEEFESSLFKNISGAGRISRFEVSELPTKIAAEVKNFSANFRDVKIDYALSAAKEAMAGVTLTSKKTCLSTGLGLELFSLPDLLENTKDNFFPELEKEQLQFINSPSDICNYMISKDNHFTQFPMVHISACAAGTDAIGQAFHYIRSGKSDFILSGGTDSMINPMGIAGFCRIGAMSVKNETPHLASMPFNKDRDGFLIGEGAGFLALEELECARARGAKIYAEIIGHGNSLDAYSISDPHPEGRGARDSMERALADANLSYREISAISCHGTGTPKNDPAEARAIRSVFKNWQDIPSFSTKSMIGHLISSSGPVELIACVLMLNRQKLHPTINLDNIDPECELNHVVGHNLEHRVEYILKNSFGFGGQNSSIIIKRWE